jgi:hypothetical protein
LFPNFFFSAGENKSESDTFVLLAQLHEDSFTSFDQCLQYYQKALDAITHGAEDGQPSDVASLMLRLASARLKRHLKDASDGSETEFADLEVTEEELRFVIECAVDLEDLHLKAHAQLELSTVSPSSNLSTRNHNRSHCLACRCSCSWVKEKKLSLLPDKQRPTLIQSEMEPLKSTP